MSKKITRGTPENPSESERLETGMTRSEYRAFLLRRAEKEARLPVKPDAVPGLDYCDQFGNYVGGKQIPGSSPDDRI